jgi:hypothetical protein
MYLNWKDSYDPDILAKKLQEIFGWTYLQANTVVETTQRNGKCLLIRETPDNISNLSIKMAKCGISFGVTELTKIK